MKEITNNQKEFLLEMFFKNELYPGWKNIGEKLIMYGYCVVPGDKCIWCGGIGNFIELEPAEDFVGCIKYKFDLSVFTKSEWYKEIKNLYLKGIKDKRDDIELKYLKEANRLDSSFNEITFLGEN